MTEETTVATLTSKGQVTIPKTLRTRLGLKPGDKVQFVEKNGVVTVQRVFNPEGLLRYRGYLKHLAGHDTDDIINEMRGR